MKGKSKYIGLHFEGTGDQKLNLIYSTTAGSGPGYAVTLTHGATSTVRENNVSEQRNLRSAFLIF